MSILRLSWANLRANSLSSLLSLLLLALGVGMVSFVMVASERFTDRFNRDIRGIDMVVGAKGSPLQLILSAVYHIDSPTGNIKLAEANRISAHPMVAKAIPLAYGDNYRGWRIVGTEHAYLSHFEAALHEGRLWEADFEVVAGSEAAALAELRIGDRFHGSHGLVADGHVHDDRHYTVVGILQPSGTVADRLLLTSIGSVWRIHDTHGQGQGHVHGPHCNHAHEDGHHHEAEEDREITALLVKFKSPMGMMQLPRFVNEQTPMQAALPAIEVNRLYQLLGVGFSALQAIGALIMLIAAISVFISLLNALKDRRAELALMRSMGASPLQLVMMVMAEAMMLCSMGWAVGIAAGRAGMWSVALLSGEQFGFGPEGGLLGMQELLLLPVALLIGIAAAAIPAIRAYRTDIAEVLRKE